MRTKVEVAIVAAGCEAMTLWDVSNGLGFSVTEEVQFISSWEW